MSVEHKPIRSFVRREGRMTQRQERAIQELWATYGIDIESSAKPIDFDQLFARQAPKYLEIGFGMGQSLLAMAQQHPEIDFIGIEVHKPGVGALLADMHDAGVTNIRVISHDAIDVLRDYVADHSIDRLLLFFPDPWPKKRHHKRRIVSSKFVQLVGLKLCSGGYLHMATDWQNYAEHMLEVMHNAGGWVNIAQNGEFVDGTQWRPETKFERRGERLGHQIFDLIYEKK